MFSRADAIAAMESTDRSGDGTKAAMNQIEFTRNVMDSMAKEAWAGKSECFFMFDTDIHPEKQIATLLRFLKESMGFSVRETPTNGTVKTVTVYWTVLEEKKEAMIDLLMEDLQIAANLVLFHHLRDSIVQKHCAQHGIKISATEQNINIEFEGKI